MVVSFPFIVVSSCFASYQVRTAFCTPYTVMVMANIFL